MEAQHIRAVAFELLHAHESMSPAAIAEAAGCDVVAVCGALGSDSERFARVAGDGCWWWMLDPLAGLGRAALPANDGSVARAWRQRVAIRERVRGAIQANPGGITVARLSQLTGLAGVEIADQLQGLRALGEVGSFKIPGMVGFEFWKESAA